MRPTTPAAHSEADTLMAVCRGCLSAATHPPARVRGSRRVRAGLCVRDLLHASTNGLR